MEFRWRSSALLLCLRCLPGLLTAGAGAAADLGGSVAISTDYVHRGVSQTRNDAALQLDLHLRGEHWLVGAWASPVQPQPERYATELDLYTQWQQPLTNELRLSTALTYYSIIDDPRVASYDYLELSAGIHWRERLLLSATWAPDVTLFSRASGPIKGQQTYTVELAGNLPLPYQLLLQAGAGYFAGMDLPHSGYSYASSSLARRFGALQVVVHYFWVEAAQQRPYMLGPAGEPWVFTVVWEF